MYSGFQKVLVKIILYGKFNEKNTIHNSPEILHAFLPVLLVTRMKFLLTWEKESLFRSHTLKCILYKCLFPKALCWRYKY